MKTVPRLSKKVESFAAESQGLQISLRDSWAARVKKERLISQSMGSLQET